MAEAQTPANVQTKEGHNPDPSVLATQALWREIAHSNELENVKIAGVEKVIDLAHGEFIRFKPDVEKMVLNLEKLLNEKIRFIEKALEGEHNLKEEKFHKVEQRFQLIETTRIEQKQEAMSALNTALQSAKEVLNAQSTNTIAAAAKSELAFTKQIDQQGELIKSIQKAQDDKINDIRERQIKMDGVTTGKKDFWGYILGAIGLLATLATLIAMIIKNSR